jgi:hypothetical protein
MVHLPSDRSSGLVSGLRLEGSEVMVTGPWRWGRQALPAPTVAALVVAGTVAVTLTGVPGAAAAGKPDIELVPPSTETLFHDDVCSFPVRQDARARQGIVQVFSDAAGEPRTVHLAGAFTATLTHLLPDGSDGPSIQVNFSGPGNVDPVTGLVSANGPWLLVGSDDPTTAAFDGLMLLVQGQVDISQNANTGGPVVESSTGRVIDLCAALA